MTTAEQVAHDELFRARLYWGGLHSPACRVAARAVESIVERCASEAESVAQGAPEVSVHVLAVKRVAALQIAARIRALAASSALQPAPAAHPVKLARGDRPVLGKFVIGADRRDKALCWAPSVDGDVLREIFTEVDALKLARPITVYGYVCTIAETKTFRFHQVEAAAPQLSVPAEPRHAWVNPTIADADGWCCTVKARGRESVTCRKKALVFCEQDHGDGMCLEGRCREHARGIATEPPCPACAILIHLPPNGMECSTHGDPREPPAAPPAGTGGR